MSNADDDMDKPITKRELNDALNAAFADFHVGMKNLFGAVRAKIEEAKVEMKAAMKIEIKALETRLTGELKSHTGSNAEQLQREVGLVDDRYKDLPVRVDKLEAAVFTPEPRAKKQRRR